VLQKGWDRRGRGSSDGWRAGAVKLDLCPLLARGPRLAVEVEEEAGREDRDDGEGGGGLVADGVVGRLLGRVDQNCKRRIGRGQRRSQERMRAHGFGLDALLAKESTA
jgi:hypothetical protein